jgi:AraC family transcriptional activator of pobA
MEGFKVYELATSSLVPATSRRDCYRVYLLSSPRLLPRADKALLRDGELCLCVGNPYQAGVVPAAGQVPGYACLFTEAFVRENGYFGGLEQWERLHGQTAVVPLRTEQAAHLTLLFQQMLVLQETAYHYKNELLHSCLQLVLHEALRYRQPVPRRFRAYYRSPAGGLLAAWRNRR